MTRVPVLVSVLFILACLPTQAAILKTHVLYDVSRLRKPIMITRLHDMNGIITMTTDDVPPNHHLLAMPDMFGTLMDIKDILTIPNIDNVLVQYHDSCGNSNVSCIGIFSMYIPKTQQVLLRNPHQWKSRMRDLLDVLKSKIASHNVEDVLNYFDAWGEDKESRRR